MHGSNDHYVGFSVDLSTYRFHRDISLYIGNNTSESAYYPDREHAGCVSSYRFYEKRQDFSVSIFSSFYVRSIVSLVCKSRMTRKQVRLLCALILIIAVITTIVFLQRSIFRKDGGKTHTLE